MRTVISLIICFALFLYLAKTTDTSKILKLKHEGIEIRTGNPDWGAEPGKIYFVIKHGELLTE